MAAAAEKLDLDLLRKKDAAEFTRFVRAYEPFILGLCQSLGLGVADRDDAAAETFAIALRALEHFRGDAELSTWLYRIAYRTAIKVRRQYPAGVPLEAENSAGDVPDPTLQRADQHAQTQETCMALWHAVSRLNPDQAVAVELFYRRQMSVEEAAAVMEKPVGTIKTLLHRARERLRVMLKSLESVNHDR